MHSLEVIEGFSWIALHKHIINIYLGSLHMFYFSEDTKIHWNEVRLIFPPKFTFTYINCTIMCFIMTSSYLHMLICIYSDVFYHDILTFWSYSPHPLALLLILILIQIRTPFYFLVFLLLLFLVMTQWISLGLFIGQWVAYPPTGYPHLPVATPLKKVSLLPQATVNCLWFFGKGGALWTPPLKW